MTNTKHHGRNRRSAATRSNRRMNAPRTRGRLFLVALLALLTAAQAPAVVYYVANTGADTNDGISPDHPWKTLRQINTQPLQPGDSVLFNRGDMWRGTLIPHSGNESACITYGAYGSGAKPRLFGSVAKDSPGDWIPAGDRLWATKEPETGGEEILKNPSFDEEGVCWNLYNEHGAAAEGMRETSDCASPPGAYRLRGIHAGTAASDIQWYTAPFTIVTGKVYRLAFSAKCTMPIDLDTPHVMRSSPPWSAYAAPIQPARIHLTDTWHAHSLYFRAQVSAQDARITFALGRTLPEGAVLTFDSMHLAECAEDTAFSCDVGNIIFDGGPSCAVKVWKAEDLTAEGRFWFDPERHTVTLVSSENPAAGHHTIECALRAHIIDQSNIGYTTYENLDLRYGAAHGVGGANTHHIVVRDCDFSYIGGGDQSGNGATVRFGNGVEFWANAHDNLVERCRLWEIYDAALTNQGSGAKIEQYNITYRHNTIWNSEYSFEYWNRPEISSTHNIRFEHNTCVNAGHGWGHAQRPDPSGRHLCFYTSDAALRDMCIQDNIFYEATGNAFYAPKWPSEAIAAVTMDHNAWYQAEGTMISINDKSYTMARWAAYQNDFAKEPHSITAIPSFTDAGKTDFRVEHGSPCAAMGAAQ